MLDLLLCSLKCNTESFLDSLKDTNLVEKNVIAQLSNLDMVLNSQSRVVCVFHNDESLSRRSPSNVSQNSNYFAASNWKESLSANEIVIRESCLSVSQFALRNCNCQFQVFRLVLLGS